jgi:amino-acid N-acetyltransferase
MMQRSARRRIRDGSAADWPAVLHLLSAEGLPTTDLNAKSLTGFLLETEGETVAEKINGAVAIESFGETGLLRSLVVDKSARSAGCGSRLIRAIEQKALASGIAELWLLTIDAEQYFAASGYRRASREATPAAHSGTAAFSSLCPCSAALMMKSLA